MGTPMPTNVFKIFRRSTIISRLNSTQQYQKIIKTGLIAYKVCFMSFYIKI